MNQVVLSLDADGFEVGFAGEYNPLFSLRVDRIIQSPPERRGQYWDLNRFEPEGTEYINEKKYVLFKQICTAFQDMFFRLCVSASSCDITLVLRETCPLWLNCMLHECLLNRFRVHSLGCIPASLASCLAAGTQEGLVIQFNWHSVDVVPVYDYRIMHNYMGSSTRGCGNDFSSYMEEDDMSSFTSRLVEERLFPSDEPKNFDADEQPLTALLNMILEKLPIDLRKPLRESLIVIGSIANHDQVKTVLVNKLTSYKMVSTIGPWSGASLYLSTHRSEVKFVKRDHYLKNGVKDWIEQIYERRNAIK